MVTLAAVGLASCSDDGSDATRQPGTTRAASSETSAVPTRRPDPCAVAPITVTGAPGQSVFVDDAKFATALAWAPDGRLFFAERAGDIKIARGDKVTTFATVPTVTTERGGGYSERSSAPKAVPAGSRILVTGSAYLNPQPRRFTLPTTDQTLISVLISVFLR